MKNFFRVNPLAVFVTALIVFSCSQENFLNPDRQMNQSITVSEARTWTENFVKQDSNLNQPYAKQDFLWKQAVKKQSKNGTSYIQVELDELKDHKRVVYDATAKTYLLAPKLQVIIYEDGNGNKHLEVMELTPTGDYATLHQGFTGDDDYTGMQIRYNWKGEFLKGYRFEKGRITGQLTPSLVTDSKARTQACEIWYRQDIYVGCTNYRYEGVAVGMSLYYSASSPPAFPPTPNFTDPASYKSCNSSWQLNGAPFQMNICSNTSDPNNPYNPFNPAGPSNPSDIFNPTPGSGLISLLELQNNKIALFGPCPGLDKWQYLIDYKVTSTVVNKLSRLAKYPEFSQPNPYNIYNDWYVQALRSATGVAINLDEFSVFMPDLPVIDGRQLSVDEFATYVRLHLNDFTAGSNTHFTTVANTGEDELTLWQSNDPVGAVLSIDIQFDPGSVIVSEASHGQESAGWVFSTIHDAINGDHPVSGARSFGVYETAGGYIFYTRGADRLTNYFHALTGLASETILGQEEQFTKADQLWQGLQTSMASFLQNHGVPNPQILTPETNRPYWTALKDAMDNNRSLSTLPCR